MAKTNFKTIDEYINSFEEDVQQKLEKVRETISEAAPEADGEIKWSRPAYTDEERILVMFAGFKNHIGFYITPSTLQMFEDDLANFKTGKGSVQFPLEEPVPKDLIHEMTEYRAWESREMGVLWKS